AMSTSPKPSTCAGAKRSSTASSVPPLFRQNVDERGVRLHRLGGVPPAREQAERVELEKARNGHEFGSLRGPRAEPLLHPYAQAGPHLSPLAHSCHATRPYI